MNRKELLQDVSINPVKIFPGRRVVSSLPGEWTSPYIGKGFETRGFRDFELGDDPRAIHLATSVRRGTDTIVERVALRDLTIMVLLDLSPSMLVREKFEIQMLTATLLLYSAWKAETTFGLAIQNGELINSYGSSIGTRHFYKLYNNLWDLYSTSGKIKNGLGRRTHISRTFPQNSMIFYCSDFIDNSGELVDIVHLWRNTRRYDFIPVVIQDEFEFTFPLITTGSFVSLENPETGGQDEVWMSEKDSVEIQNINENRYKRLCDSFNKNNTFFTHLHDANLSHIKKSFLHFFDQRKRRGSG